MQDIRTHTLGSHKNSVKTSIQDSNSNFNKKRVIFYTSYNSYKSGKTMNKSITNPVVVAYGSRLSMEIDMEGNELCDQIIRTIIEKK